MNGYSIDLLQRVLAAVTRGMPRQDVATTFGVSVATIKRLLAKQRTGADLAPRAPSGRRRTIAPAQVAALQAQLDAHPDATFAHHADQWNAAHGTSLSQWTLGRAIRRLHWTQKKSLIAMERDEAQRAALGARILQRAARNVVLIDEKGCRRTLERSRGRSASAGCLLSG